MRRIPAPLALALASTLAACGGAIGPSASLSEVMAYQSSAVDPLFPRIGATSFSDAELDALGAASAKVRAASRRIHDFSMGSDFDALATRLHDRAEELGDAARAKDAGKVNAALTGMRQTCKDCHRAFR